jgi:hypothetical protein
LETLASPLVNTPDSIEVVVDAAAGDVMKTGCARPAATTATATTRATNEAPATDTRATRIDEVMPGARRAQSPYHANAANAVG